MKTKLVEFKNCNGAVLRGILAVPEWQAIGGAILLQGFERNATVEKKFRRMADALAENNIASLRFDSAGCGLSDGDFSNTTLRGRASELMKAVEFFRNEFSGLKIDFVTHSLGACAIALELEKLAPLIGRMVFIAPALNQKDLLRFYFVRDLMKKENPGIEITWENYLQYLDEEKFLVDCGRRKTMKENYVSKNYCLEAKDLDLSRSFESVKEKILHVQGEFDQKVPLKNLNIEFPNRIIVPGGDHDLERPDFWDRWFSRAVDFLTDK